MLRADLMIQQFRNSTPNTVMGWSVGGVPTNIGVFTPATSLLDGSIGLVPKPLLGQQDYILSAHGWIVAPTGGGGGGSAPGGVLTEMQINAGPTTFGGSKIFVPSSGNIVLGDVALVGNRTIGLASSSTNSNLILQYKGSLGSLRIQEGVFDRAVFGSNGISFNTTGVFTVLDTTDGDGLYYSTTANRLSYEASALAGPTTFTIEGGSGTSGNNNAGNVILKGANAFASAGNGNGGNVTIQAGQRRAAGSGTDGSVTIDGLSSFINFAAASFRLNGAVAGDLATMFFGADGTWKVPAGTGLTPAGVDTEIQIKNAAALGAGKVFIPSDGNLTFGDAGLAGTLRAFTVAGSGAELAFKFTNKSSTLQRSVYIGALSSATIPGSVDIGDIVIGADVASSSERLISAGCQTGGNADLGFRSSGNTGQINFHSNAINITQRAGLNVGGITVSIGSSIGGEDSYTQQQTTTFNKPLSFRASHGDASINNGRPIMIIAGSALTSSGNGNGGSITIQSGQRRTAGSGSDGAIAIDARSGSMLISALGGVSVNAGTNAAGITAGGIELITNSVSVRGTTNPVVTIGDATNISSKLKSNDGTLGAVNGAVLNVNGGDAYNASGNGNGGNIVITSGQRRVSGTGVDGNITIDSLTGFLIIATIPTSPVGLPSGAVWANTNILTIVP